LRTDNQSSLRGMLGHLVQDGLESFGKLHELFGPDAKENVWNEVFTDYAFEGGGLWKLFADFPEREEQFTRAMLSLELLGGKAMARDVPFHKFQRVVDIGGNLGHFLHKIMTLNPQGKGVLFDRPQVLAHAKEYWFEQEGMYHDGTEKRLEMVEGSFFDANDIPDAQDGDVYLMRYILHNWGHEECLKILSNLKSKMQGKKATLMIGESSIPDRDTVGVPNAMYKIDMHMMNLFGHPLDRTPQQWKDLLDEAGFEFVAIHPTRSLIHFVEAIPLP
jgi:C-methyltransferase